MKTLANIGRYALLAVLVSAIAFIIGYCAVIGEVGISIITIGAIGMFLGTSKIINQKQ